MDRYSPPRARSHTHTEGDRKQTHAKHMRRQSFFLSIVWGIFCYQKRPEAKLLHSPCSTVRENGVQTTEASAIVNT